MLGNTETVDEYVVRMLPTICQWMAVRFIIFEGIMAHQSDVSRNEPCFFSNQVKEAIHPLLGLYNDVLNWQRFFKDDLD